MDQVKEVWIKIYEKKLIDETKWSEETYLQNQSTCKMHKNKTKISPTFRGNFFTVSVFPGVAHKNIAPVAQMPKLMHQ